jgi:hypothetical protein
MSIEFIAYATANFQRGPLLVALFPSLWMGLFTSDDEIVRVGALYLKIVGPIYGFYGLGMALYFATQGFGSVIWTVTANAVRLLTSTGCALVAIYWLDLGTIGFFVGIAGAFCAYAALTSAAIFRVKEPTALTTRPHLGRRSRAVSARRLSAAGVIALPPRYRPTRPRADPV